MNLIKRILLAALVSLFFIIPSTVNAQAYGEGNYGACLYGEGCAPTPTPTPEPGPDNNEPSSTGGSSGSESESVPVGDTVVTTPDGLEVAINLQQGQKIPASGYTVIFTPLNGRGSSFDRVEIFINGKFITTVKPENTGTAYWFWDTAKYQGSNLKFIIYNKDGTSTTKEFKVSIESQSAPSTTKSEQGFWEKLFGYLADHPWTWAVIIFIPLLLWLIIFLIKRSRNNTTGVGYN